MKTVSTQFERMIYITYKHLHYEEKNKTFQLISANVHFTREHGFEYINLTEIEENPIIGKVVFGFRKWK